MRCFQGLISYLSLLLHLLLQDVQVCGIAVLIPFVKKLSEFALLLQTLFLEVLLIRFQTFFSLIAFRILPNTTCTGKMSKTKQPTTDHNFKNHCWKYGVFSVDFLSYTDILQCVLNPNTQHKSGENDQNLLQLDGAQCRLRGLLLFPDLQSHRKAPLCI